MNQQPLMHQLRMRPLKPFSRWTRNTSSLPEIISFFPPLLWAKNFPYLPPTPPSYLPLHRSGAVVTRTRTEWTEWARAKWIATEWAGAKWVATERAGAKWVATEWAGAKWTTTKWAGAKWTTTKWAWAKWATTKWIIEWLGVRPQAVHALEAWS